MMGGMMGAGTNPAMVEMMREMVQLAGSPERRFLDAINRSLWFSGAIAMAAALLLGLLASRRITAPLHRMARAAGKVAAGDFAQRVQVESRDELEALAGAFNAMAESLARNEAQRRQLQSDIAHELKTPLSIIQGNLEGMMDGVVEPTSERLGSLREEVLLLNRLVNDLRDISIAEAGGLRLHLEPMDLGALVQAAVEGIRPEAAERGVAIAVDVPPDLPAVSADGHRVAQVLRNLLGNALRYTPAGGTITLSAVAEWVRGSEEVSERGRERGSGSEPRTQNSEPGSVLIPTPNPQHPTPNRVRVTVADTGAGIPPEHLPHVFDRFYRVDRSRTRASGGTGLGLSVAKQLVEAHGGRIWAESSLGHGSAFHFTLPAR
jgi:two-component system OmpR family sensor kinase